MAQITTTTIQDTIYSANGSVASGSVLISWPSFSTAANGTVAAGSTTVTIGADGFFSLSLTPNEGATPTGTYYTAVYHLSDGTVSKEFWLVPAVAQATIAAIRTQVVPAAVAMQTASKAYVDTSIADLSQTYVAVTGGSMTGPLVLSADPSASSQATTKHYVDAQISTLAGTIGSGNDVNAIHSNTAGPQSVEGALAAAALTAPLLNHVAYADQFSSVQAAVTAACAASPVEMVVIPNAVAVATASPEFTNPCGAAVIDQRVAHADAFDVRAYGAVCNGSTDDTVALQATINAASASLAQAGRFSAQVQLPDSTCRGNVTLPSGISFNGHLGSRVGGSQLGGVVPGLPVISVAAGASSVGIHDVDLFGVGLSTVLQAVALSRVNGIVTVTSSASIPTTLNAGTPVFLYGASTDTTFNGIYSVATISSVTAGGVTSHGPTFTYSQIATLAQCTRSSNVVTCTTPAPLPNNAFSAFASGSSVTVSGAADTSYNGTFVVTALGSYQGGANYPASISYAQSGANSSTTGGTVYPVNSTISPGLATDLGGGSGVIASAVRTANTLALTIAGPPIYGWGGDGQLTISGSSDVTLNGTWTIVGYTPGANYIAVTNAGSNEIVSAGAVGNMMDKGIWIPNGTAIHVERVGGFNFGDGLVDWEGGEVLFLNQLQATNCLQDVTTKILRQLPAYPPATGSTVAPVSPMGCVVMNGTDGYMEYSEISTGSASTSGTVSAVDITLPSKAIVNGWNGVNNWYQANIGELSDEGIWSGGQFNRWYMNRADLNAGSGIEDQSNLSIWTGNLALHDGSDQTVAPGQWYGINETGYGQNQLGGNVWTGNSVVDTAPLAADIHDGRTSASGAPNQWSNNLAQTYATPAGFSGSFLFADNDFKQNFNPFTGVSGQNVSGLHNVLLQASSNSGISNFTGGVPGQRIQVESNDGNTTLLPSGGYSLRTCSGYPFVPVAGNGTVGFTLQGDYEMAWQMDCPQVSPWQLEGHGSLALLQTTNPTVIPTIVVSGAAGTSAYSYVCSQVNYQGGETLPTPAGSTSTGNATLTAGNNNTILCPVASATSLSYQKVYRTVIPTGSALQLGYIGQTALIGFTGLVDSGQAILNTSTPPTVNHTADFSTQGSFSAGGGSTVTSSSNLAQINQANSFVAGQVFTGGLSAGTTGQTTVDGAGNLTATGTAKLTSLIAGGPRVDVRFYGAVGDGITDNCTALTTAAAAAAGGVLYVPPLVFVTSCALNLAVNGSLYIEPSGVIQAKAGSGISAVVVAGATGFWTDQIITGGGTLDANNTALRALWLKRQYRGRLANLRMINATSYCMQNGDTADAYTGSNSLDAVEFWCYRTSGSAIPTGSYGIWTDNATDSKYVQGYVKGYAEGVRDDVGGSRYGYLHVWDTNQSGSMTTCFDDNAQGNWWSDNVCDTPTQYGAILRSYNSHWSNNRFELNGTYGVTNVAIGFHSINADPTSFFVGNEFTSTVTTGMAWAKDFDITPVANMQSEFVANRPTYVTTKTVGTNDYLRSTNSFGSYKDFGAHTMNSANVVTWSATPTFTLGYENVQKLILAGNVTSSTWTSSGALQQFLVIICQNATGGYTFNWGRVVFPGGTAPTVSTAANSCSTEMFYDDGTAIRATSPMQLNE